MRSGLVRAVVAGVAALVLVSWVRPALGADLLSDRSDSSILKISVEDTYYFPEEVKTQGKDLSVNFLDVRVRHPLWGREIKTGAEKPKTEGPQPTNFGAEFQEHPRAQAIFLESDFKWQNLSEEPPLKRSGRLVPDNLYDVSFTLSYVEKFPTWAFLFDATGRSASDEPFHSTDEMDFSVKALAVKPHGANGAFIFGLYYNSDPAVARSFPIPIFAYMYQPSDRLKAVLGLPFANISARPLERLTIEAAVYPPRTARADIQYKFLEWMGVYGAFETRETDYRLLHRVGDEERLFYLEKTAGGGLRFWAGKGFKVDASGGYAFDRSFHASKSFDSERDRAEIRAGPYVRLKASYKF